MLGRAARRIADTLFGGGCYLCRGRAAAGVVCDACAADLPRAPRECCPQCALATPAGNVCGRCLSRPPRFDATHAALAFAFPADVIVHSLKYRAELALAPFAAGLIDACLGAPEPVSALVPVPLSAARLRERGFNQAMEIARHVARLRGVRLAPELCERVRDTGPQMPLPYAERRRNVRGAFRCPAPLAPATIAVLDDVMTTGATLDEIAATLKQAGAARVVNWVLARTPPPADV